MFLNQDLNSINIRQHCTTFFILIKSIILFLILVLLQALFAAAQTPSGLDTESLQNDSVIKGVERLQNFTDKERLEYLSEQWKETLSDCYGRGF